MLYCIPDKIYNSNAWIFDMDGTLTCPIHDFDQYRKSKGMNPDKPVLESIMDLPEPLRGKALEELMSWEKTLASQAIAAPGASRLLEHLLERGRYIGVLTRNTRDLALITLKAAGLYDYFSDKDILGRTCTRPKPHPEGCLNLLDKWNVDPACATMVGDYIFDIKAGTNAGMHTIYIGSDDSTSKLSDLSIERLDMLLS